MDEQRVPDLEELDELQVRHFLAERRRSGGLSWSNGLKEASSSRYQVSGCSSGNRAKLTGDSLFS
jgi:hypothetical protein